MYSKIKIPEYRADKPKTLAEQRAAAVQEMQNIIDAASAEERAMTDEETARLAALEKSVNDIDRSVEAEKRAMKFLKTQSSNEKQVEENESGELPVATEIPESDRRAFMNTVRDLAEKRAGEQNFDMGNNGAIIPQSIAHRIITEVKEYCPILAGCTMYSVKGTLKVPVYGDKTIDGTAHNITVGYAEEFKRLVGDAGAFTSIDLTGHLVGVLTLIGKSVINNSDISIVDFIITEMAKRIAIWIENELLNGVGGADACTGVVSSANVFKSGSENSITADMLIDLQSEIPTPFQSGCCWTMNPKTFALLRKLKDSTGQYLLQTAPNIINGFPYMLLGKPVYLSDNMPLPKKDSKVILYGDYSGLSVNMREHIEMQLLNESYYTMHAVGICAWLELDSKLTEKQKLAVMQMSVV